MNKLESIIFKFLTKVIIALPGRVLNGYKTAEIFGIKLTVPIASSDSSPTRKSK